MFDDGCPKTGRDAIASFEAFLEMCRGDFQRIAFKSSDGESIPGMERKLRWALASVEPDHAVAGSLLIRNTVCDELTTDGVDDPGDAHWVQSFRLIPRTTRPARKQRRGRNPFLVVGVSAHACRVIQRNTTVVA